MHGRVKVRTSEEEKARKKKEQELKVKAYKAAMTKIQAKRRQQEYDDELLQLTAQILLRNPDVTTLWNIRRECVLHKVEQLAEASSDETQAIFDAEVALTEQSLMVNPKSYYSWHHRIWALEKCPQANWEREVQLCNKYLKYDERNFHTWNYRRYVVEKAGVDKKQELDYCTEKIKINFSNYSSWHYRSLLLPVLYPYEGNAVPRRAMSETKLKEELEMVLTAAFTDPNDSSAWFYQRWLLGYSRPELEIAAFRCDKEMAVLVLSKPINGQCIEMSIGVDSGEQNLKLTSWQSLNNSKFDTVWLAELPLNHTLNHPNAAALELKVNIPTLTTQTLHTKPHNGTHYYVIPPNRSVAFSGDVLTELQTQLDSCNSLLEYEPDSKWTLLTSALLMRAIDRQLHHSKSLEFLSKLQKVDELREGYYKDLASKWIMEYVLTKWCDSETVPGVLDLSNEKQLSSLAYGQYLCIADGIIPPPHLQTLFDTKFKTFKMLKTN